MDALRLEKCREVTGRRDDGISARGESREEFERPPRARRHTIAQCPPLPIAEHRVEQPGKRERSVDADVEAIVHRVHDGNGPFQGEAIPKRRSPEIGLHVDDIDWRTRFEPLLDESKVRCSRPQPGVVLHRRDRPRRQIDELRRCHGPGAQGGRHERDRVTQAFKKFCLQHDRHLGSPECVGMLLAKDQDVHRRPSLLGDES